MWKTFLQTNVGLTSSHCCAVISKDIDFQLVSSLSSSDFKNVKYNTVSKNYPIKTWGHCNKIDPM